MMNFSTSMPASPAPAPQVPELSSASLLALDLGTTTGWAMVPPNGGIVSGTVSCKFYQTMKNIPVNEGC